jgi:G3E family GTPase
MAVETAGERIPVSLVTGFLGSGKTTLIAALLRQPAMAGAAVVVNEFGAVGIDDAIFAQSVDAENVLLLANGCLCCTAGDDLAATVWSLARQPERPRKIVIETTGLADPAPVLRRLMGDPRLAQATRLDTVVATIDALSGLDNLDHQPVAARQCAVADRRVITKSDIAEPSDVEALKQRLRALNPSAEILQVNHGAIDADDLFSASLYDAKAGVSDVDRWLNVEAHHGHAHEHRHRHDHDDHSHGAKTWLLEEDRLVDWEAFLQKLGAIIGRHGESLLRVKGVIHASDDPRPIVIHGVQRMFHPPVRLHSWKSAPGTKIVIIGESAAEPAVAEIANALSDSAIPQTPAGPRREKLTA